jgi:hypothetical protein
MSRQELRLKMLKYGFVLALAAIVGLTIIVLAIFAPDSLNYCDPTPAPTHHQEK